MAKWEYKTVCIEATGFRGDEEDCDSLDSLLNDMGREGWELVTAIDSEQHYAQARKVYYTFKRMVG